jgi:4-cresol dehydrogenase (hydroxylating)
MSLPRAAAYSVTRAACQSVAGPLREAARSKLMASLELGSWNLYGALYGAEPVMDNQWRVIAQALRNVPGVRLHFADTRANDAAFSCRAALLSGTPTMDEYKTLDWVGAGAHLDFSAVLPFDGDTAVTSCNAALELCHDHGFDYIAELQLDARSLRHEVRIVFERGVDAQRRAAHDLHAALAARAIQDGQGSPRAHLAFMDDVAASYKRNDNALLRANEAIKDVLDPQGLLAPGKSGLWAGRYAPRKKK